MHMIHIGITHCLGQDGRGTDAFFTAVAPDDGARRDTAESRQVGQAIAVDQKFRARYGQREDGAAHRQERRLQDVQGVDLRRVGPTDAVGDASRADLGSQSMPRRRIQGFGIIDAANAMPR